ncbi:hypothetical protein [Merismopedia glauca]|uniref:Uncharacterized protein n=1 Tax=Merismopedia glauca CCAP 1448/3 TaxID=1296344 RepID=A0A2T1C8J2_9CYAN|nr:hypothetical protein [Merismopedia glauca]PSB04595.1 hypothetical protein C7B64_03325 [Merismopedia glauca CCAP 1448/3]
MNLSPKAIRFIIEALDYRIEAYQQHLQLENLDEDEASDITNDALFLESLRQELTNNLRVITSQSV